MRLSLLDYVPLFEGRTPNDALKHSIKLAQYAEKLGYLRYWVAEHHQVYSVVSSALEIIMMSILEHTQHIRVGSGGVMLPHYSPYKVAELFKIMEARHPHRIDMAIGRSPSFKNVNEALNENKNEKLPFNTQITDLLKYFNNDTSQDHRFKSLLATPMVTSFPQLYILGMSIRSAKLAAQRGLPFVIARMGQSETDLHEAISTYRKYFKAYHGEINNAKPYVILATFVVTASNLSRVKQLLHALQLWLMRINYLNQPKSYPSIETAQNKHYSQRELEKLEKMKSKIIYGMPNDVAEQLTLLHQQFKVDEILILPHVFGEDARMELIELIANELITSCSRDEF